MKIETEKKPLSFSQTVKKTNFLFLYPPYINVCYILNLNKFLLLNKRVLYFKNMQNLLKGIFYLYIYLYILESKCPEMHVKKVEFKKMIFEKKKIHIFFSGKLLRKFWKLFPGIGFKETFSGNSQEFPQILSTFFSGFSAEFCIKKLPGIGNKKLLG